MYIKDDSHYVNSLKNKGKKGGKIRWWNPRVKLGNSTSCSGSRPSAHVTGNCKMRLVEKRINNEATAYKIIDSHVDIGKPDIYRKTSMQTSIPYEEKNIYNRQEQSNDNNLRNSKGDYRLLKNEKLADMVKYKEQPKIVNLDGIDKRLWIGNRYAINLYFKRDYKITHIIDLTNVGCEKLQKDIILHRIEMRDCSTISHKTFHNILQNVIDIIDGLKEDDRVLIVCDGGINRSVSVIMGYAIKRRGLSYNEALAAIEKAKNDDNWHNLTNLRLINLLRKIQIVKMEVNNMHQ